MAKKAKGIICDDHIFDHAAIDSETQVRKQLFVLTRFTMPSPNSRLKGGFVDEQRFKEWCINRCKIFKRICLPSILKQNSRPSGWFLIFDSRYLEETREALEAINNYDWIIPIIVNGNEKVPTMRELFTDAILKRLDPLTEYVITVRLDNDDALSYLYCEAVEQYVQSVFCKKLKLEFIISFPYGVQWDDKEMTLLVKNNSAFLAYVESAELVRQKKAILVTACNHSEVYKNRDVKTPITLFPMWLQYVHSENVINFKDKISWAFRDLHNLYEFFGIRQ
jgi:hypothetical protein